MKINVRIHPPRSFCLAFLLVIISGNMESDLVKHLLTNNTSSTRPLGDPRTNINVTFNMKLWQVLSINEKEQTINIYCTYDMHWRNEITTWNPKQWRDIEHVKVSPAEIWVPDIVLTNSADSNPDNVQKGTDRVRVYYNGDNYWYPKLMLTASFTAETRYFPFDLQRFSFSFESWNLDESELRILKSDDLMIYDYYLNNTQWELVKTEKILTSVRYASDNKSYSDLTFAYTYRRRPSYFIMTLILPIIITILIVLSSYFLPPASGERMGVVITILLAFAVFLEVVSSSLPQNAISTSLLSIYILLSMCESAMSFFVTCLVITLLHKGRDGNSLPPLWVRRFFLRTGKHRSVVNRWKSCNYSVHDIEALGELSAYYNIGYQERGTDKSQQTPSGSAQIRKRCTILNCVQDEKVKGISTPMENISSCRGRETMRNHQDICQREWTRIAKTLDRMSFWTFLFVALSSLSILAVAYKQHN